MKKLFLTLIAAGAFLIAPSFSQAQDISAVSNQTSNSELVQLTDQLNQIAISLERVAKVLDYHTNKTVDVKDSKLSQKINELRDNLERATQKIEQIKADRKIHSAPENDEDDLQDLA